MGFTQTITVQADGADQLTSLLRDWHRDQRGAAPGYQGARLLADKDHAGRFVIEVDFASEADAQENNARSETQAWAQKLQGFAKGEPEYRNYELAYTTE